MSTLTVLKTWLRAATNAEREQMAQRAGTSTQYLNHLAAGEETNYRREPKPALAAAIERETKVMAKASMGRLPIVYRTDLVTACRQCEFARKCLGQDIIVRGDFPIVVTAEAESEGGHAD